MSKIKQLFLDTKQQNMLYHYTSLITLFKIMEGITFHDNEYFLQLKTNRIDNVNDPTEICTDPMVYMDLIKSYEVEKGKNFLSSILNSFDPQKLRTLMKEEKEEYPPYITCFSTQEDYLPMWSLYGNKHEGVCLCFEKSEIIRMQENQTNCLILSGEVSYSEHIKSQTLKNLLEVYETCPSLLKDNPEENFALLFSSIAPFIKNESYSYEKEFRFCKINYIEKEKQYVEYDKRLDSLYIEFPLVSLKQIILGTKLPNKILPQFLTCYFARKEINIIVKRSSIPFL